MGKRRFKKRKGKPNLTAEYAKLKIQEEYKKYNLPPTMKKKKKKIKSRRGDRKAKKKDNNSNKKNQKLPHNIEASKIANLKQEDGESFQGFMQRIDDQTNKKLEIMPSIATNFSKREKFKKKQKKNLMKTKQKILLKMRDKQEDKKINFKENIKFGEVVESPPTFSLVKSKKKHMNNFKKSQKDLLIASTKTFEEKVGEKSNEIYRQRVILAYKELRAKRKWSKQIKE